MNATAPFLLAILVLMVSCETMNTSPNAAPDKTNSLARVAGMWRFSHAGAPSISNDATKGLVSEARKNMKDTKLLIQKSGDASLIALGKSMAFQVEVIEETPLYIKLGKPGHEGAYTYDKSSKLLAMPMDLDIDGEKGTMPAYFKR